ATNNLIKVIKRNAFGFRNFENFKKRILIALNIKKERTKFVLSQIADKHRFGVCLFYCF
ncbi:transposase, partial [Streptococcus suis]